MKRATIGLVILSLAGLAACSPKAEGGKTTATPAVAASPPATATASDAKMAKGTGKVMAVDAKAGTVTLQHGPIAEAGWPAMTMAFKASPAIVSQVKTGDQVDFDLLLKDGGGEVTAVHKAPQ